MGSQLIVFIPIPLLVPLPNKIKDDKYDRQNNKDDEIERF
jgi:hypothetical protein